MKETIYIIDGYGLIYRSYFAFIRAPRFNPQGENSSAVYGFFLTLLNLIKQKNPLYLAVVMDSTEPTFRLDLYPEYKAGREKTPPDLHAQIPRIEGILQAMGIPVFRKPKFEADDIIAHIARWGDQKGYPAAIVSKDKDLFQLVTENVSILYPDKGPGGFQLWNRDEVFENKGVYPEQIVDFLSLTGDSSDNIPGVLGIGEKTAVKLLAEYGTLEDIFQNLEKITAKAQKKKLTEGKESAYFSRGLIVLNHDVELDLSLEVLRIGEGDNNKILELFHQEGIKTFDKDFASDLPEEHPLPVEEGKKGTYHLITSFEELDRWMKEAEEAGVVAFDLETDNIDEMYAHPIGFSFTFKEEEGYYLPIKAIGVECLPEKEVKTRLKNFLEAGKVKIVGQNFKYDYKVLKRWGIEVPEIYFDTMIAAWVLDSTLNTYNMDKLAERHFHYTTIHYEDLIPKKENLTLADIEIEKVRDYAAEDADITFRLYKHFDTLLAESKELRSLFLDIEMPLLKILGDMELEGITLLPEPLKEYSKELDRELAAIADKIYITCGETFNIRSTKELQVILFEKRGLKPVKKTKTGYSTDATVLELLAHEDEVAGMILHHRLLSKLKSTYVDTLPQLLNRNTGRIHTTFLQTGTATGRIASNNPNLQNIPIKDKEGRRIRSAFVSREGHFLLSADYSQIELVVLAHLADEKNLIEAFEEGIDIHTHTASILFDEEEKDVTPAQRRIGKTINFAVIYGMSAFRMSRELQIPRNDAAKFIDTYFEEYAGVNAFKEKTIKEAEKKRYVETILGRRRKLININNKNKTVKMADERIALNTPIQGSAADIVKLAMLKIDKELKANKLTSRLILQVHDELILEVPEKEVDQVKELIPRVMESVIPLKAPLKVNVEVKKSWDQIH